MRWAIWYTYCPWSKTLHYYAAIIFAMRLWYYDIMICRYYTYAYDIICYYMSIYGAAQRRYCSSMSIHIDELYVPHVIIKICWFATYDITVVRSAIIWYYYDAILLCWRTWYIMLFHLLLLCWYYYMLWYICYDDAIMI